MLTFEKIRDLERAERESKKLQKLPEGFLEEVQEYIQRKQKLKEKTSSDLLELQNARTIIKNLFEAREKKLIELALYTARTGIPAENLGAREEKAFFFLVDELRRLREHFFEDVNREHQPKILYKVKRTMPAFVGPDMKTYELKEGETVELPEALNELLLKEGVIERIEK